MLIAVASGVFGVVIGMYGEATSVPPAPAMVEPDVTTEDVPADVEPGDQYSEEPSEPADTGSAIAIEKRDLKLRVKIISKQCFGSAGCNVEARAVPYDLDKLDWPSTGSVEVSYKMTGDESGPIIDSFVINLDDDTYEQPSDQIMSTRSSGTKIAATITDVEYLE